MVRGIGSFEVGQSQRWEPQPPNHFTRPGPSLSWGVMGVKLKRTRVQTPNKL